MQSLTKFWLLEKSLIRVYSFLYILLLFSFGNGFSQTGPGGIGSTDGTSILELWFDSYDVNGDGTNPASGTDVSTWYDKSGNAVDVTENIASVATYANPGVTFNNTGYLLGSDAGLPSGSASRTVFVVASSPNTAVDDVLFFYGNASNDNSFGILKLSGGGVRSYFYANDLDDASGWTPVGTTKIVGSKYISGGARSIYVDGTTTASATPSSPNTTTGTQGLQIGGWNSFSLFSNSTIYEILFYSSAINEAQRYIVENYLAARHGRTLSTHDIYDEDDAGNGNFDYGVAGIGRVNASNIHNDAQGTGIIRINNPTGLGDNEFLIWGHNNDSLAAIEVADIPIGIQARFERIWRASEANSSGTAVDVGSVDISFDLTGLGTIIASDLRLLIDTDNDGVFTDETPISGASSLGSNIYQFSAVSTITNNVRFTLGTINASQTPLPIELSSFEAEIVEDNVLLKWKTWSEINNDFFTVERSSNTVDWEIVGNIDGAGNSSIISTYEMLDKFPYENTSYYRLKQTDFNGDFSYVGLVEVKIVPKNGFYVYPNPVGKEGGLYLLNKELIGGEPLEFQLRNSYGELIYQKQIKTENTLQEKINTSELTSGTYFILLFDDHKVSTIPIYITK